MGQWPAKIYGKQQMRRFSCFRTRVSLCVSESLKDIASSVSAGACGFPFCLRLNCGCTNAVYVVAEDLHRLQHMNTAQFQALFCKKYLTSP